MLRALRHRFPPPQDHKDDADFGKECRSQVQEYEAQATSDYRLNYRLSKACKADIGDLCGDVCNSDDGTVSTAR